MVTNFIKKLREDGSLSMLLFGVVFAIIFSFLGSFIGTIQGLSSINPDGMKERNAFVGAVIGFAPVGLLVWQYLQNKKHKIIQKTESPRIGTTAGCILCIVYVVMILLLSYSLSIIVPKIL